VAVFVTIAMVISLGSFLQKTFVGMALRAVSQDVVGAKIVGISTNRITMYAFAIASLIAGVSGMLLAPRTLLYPLVGWEVLMKAFVVVVFGGIGSIKGTLYAGFIIGMTDVFVTGFIGAVWNLPMFLVFLLILLVFKPRGLFGTW